MKNRSGLPNTLKRLKRTLKLFQTRIRSDCFRTANSEDEMEMIDVSREIVHLRSAMLEMSNELALVSRQMYILTMNKARCVPISQKRNQRKAPMVRGKKLGQAFAALPSGATGGVVIGICHNVAGFSFQQQYGCFNTWTEAQSFAALLNKRLGINPHDAMEIMISSDLATKAVGAKRPPLHISLNP